MNGGGRAGGVGWDGTGGKGWDGTGGGWDGTGGVGGVGGVGQVGEVGQVGQVAEVGTALGKETCLYFIASHKHLPTTATPTPDVTCRYTCQALA